METKPQDDRETETAAPAPDEHEPVQIFDTAQESEAMVVKGLLESAGIDAVITPLDADQEIFPGVGGVVVRVLPDKAEEARKLIEEYRASGEEPDSDVNDDSAA